MRSIDAEYGGLNMDLISREAAIKFANEQMVKETGAYSKGRNAALLVMKSALNNHDAIPPVPAVPLDKLCEFLGGAVTPCLLLNICCPYNEATRKDCDSCIAREAWKITLSKWMEEQDADRK